MTDITPFWTFASKCLLQTFTPSFEVLRTFAPEVRARIWHQYLSAHVKYYHLYKQSRELPILTGSDPRISGMEMRTFVVDHVGPAGYRPPLWMAGLTIYPDPGAFRDFWNLSSHRILFSFISSAHMDDFAQGISQMMPETPNEQAHRINIEIRACEARTFASEPQYPFLKRDDVLTTYYKAQQHFDKWIEDFNKFGEGVQVHTLLKLHQPWQRYDDLRAVTAPLRTHPHTVQVTFGDGWRAFSQVHRELSIASVQGFDLSPELQAAKERVLEFIEDY